MLTTAHIHSRGSVIDPAYSAEKICPDLQPRSEFPYLYAPEDLLSARLEEMLESGKKAKLRVDYPGKRRAPFRQLFFVSRYTGGEGRFHCPGTAALYLNGMEIPIRYEDGTFFFTAPEGVLTAVICGDTASFQPLWHGVWGCTDSPARPTVPAEEHYPAECSDIPPHLEELPFVEIVPEKTESGLYDAGREVLAYVTLRAHDIDLFRAGETKAEALSGDPDGFEQSAELTELLPGVWHSTVPLAFRYLNIEGCDLKRVRCQAVYTPECYRGAFATDDRELNDIWMRAAYTLRLCHRHFLIDGVKRDRLPWSGDLRISLLSSCFTFADSRVVESTLQLLGSSGVLGHINGITDYSLWYIINQETWQLYSGHHEFLAQEYPKITVILENLIREENADTGFLEPGKWTLIDWFDFDKTSSLQLLYCWALKSGAQLAHRMADSAHETLWSGKAEALAKRIRDVFRDPATGVYRDGTKDHSLHRYANFLAVLSGVETQPDAIAGLLSGEELPSVGTPYMAAMEIKALADAGCREQALKKLRNLWGAMLKDGATTFYEAFDPALPDTERYRFYGRPFGLSLCHAWGAGPAWLLPEIFFGIRPVEDGWKTFRVEPAGFIQGNVYLTVPTPHGEIELAYEGGRLSVKAPGNTKRVL